MRSSVLFPLLLAPLGFSEASSLAGADLLADAGKDNFKVVFLLKQKSPLLVDDFAQAWVSARKNAVPVKGLLQEIYNDIQMDEAMRIKTGASFNFAGVEELWFDSQESAHSYLADFALELSKNAALSSILDQNATVAMGGVCSTIIANSLRTPDERVKLLVLAVRRAGMSFAEYSDYWINHHGALVRAAPNADKKHYRVEYCPVQNVTGYQFSTAPYDGLATIQFHSLEDLKSTFDNDYYRQTLAHDEPKFGDRQKTFGARATETLIYSAPQL